MWDKMCDDKRCDDKMCEDKRCDNKMCEDKLVRTRCVCVSKLCVEEAAGGGGGRRRRDTEPKIKGPDNPTCQLLPTSSKRKVKMAWGKQEREKRWCRIGVEQVVCGRVSVSTLCGDKLCVRCVCVCVCVCVRAEVVTGKEGKTKEVVKRFEK